MEGQPESIPEKATVPRAQPVPTEIRPQSATTREKILIDLEQVTVSEFLDYLPSLVSLLLHECDNFRAGRVSNFLPEWKSLTSDPDILSNVSGVKIECDFLPEQPARNKSHFNQTEFHIIQKEIETLISKGVLEATSPSAGQIISPIFLRPKPGRNTQDDTQSQTI